MTLAELKKGQVGIIREHSLDAAHIKLLEMGLLPGHTVQLVKVAPLNDPIYYNVNGSHIAIRKSIAKTIELDIL